MSLRLPVASRTTEQGRGDSVKSGAYRTSRVAKRAIHHMTLEDLAAINREVVALTNEPHEYSAADGEQMEELLAEVERRTSEGEQGAIAEKAALLVYKIASGQHFHGGNKRTALVAGEVFLLKNGRKIDFTDSSLVSVVDRVGIAAASLDDLRVVIEGLMSKTKLERKSWQSVIKQVVDSNKKFLVEAGS